MNCSFCTFFNSFFLLMNWQTSDILFFSDKPVITHLPRTIYGIFSSFQIFRCYVAKYMTLRETCPYSEFFWSVFSLIQTEYGEILSITSYSVQIRENTDQKNSKHGHFSRSEKLRKYSPYCTRNCAITNAYFRGV